jgi:hypothetical protein
MMKSVENKEKAATIAPKKEVAGKTKPLFGLQKRCIQPERYVPFFSKQDFNLNLKKCQDGYLEA